MAPVKPASCVMEQRWALAARKMFEENLTNFPRFRVLLPAFRHFRRFLIGVDRVALRAKLTACRLGCVLLVARLALIACKNFLSGSGRKALSLETAGPEG